MDTDLAYHSYILNDDHVLRCDDGKIIVFNILDALITGSILVLQLAVIES